MAILAAAHPSPKLPQLQPGNPPKLQKGDTKFVPHLQNLQHISHIRHLALSKPLSKVSCNNSINSINCNIWRFNQTDVNKRDELLYPSPLSL
jgi:hypothetical protein